MYVTDCHDMTIAVKVALNLNITNQLHVISSSLLQVSALAFDPSGARLITGGYDYDVKLFDFAGMDSTLKPFRSLRPCEWYLVSSTVSLSFPFYVIYKSIQLHSSLTAVRCFDNGFVGK